jgi:histidine triad (HIT) family protein
MDRLVILVSHSTHIGFRADQQEAIGVKVFSMSADCLFCKIVAGTIPAKKIYEDELCLCFADIHPQAPTHVLLVPKEHIASTTHAEEQHAPLLGHLLAKAAEIARGAALSRGYRVVINTGPDGGQTVDHLHLHLLGGRAMSWPPG